MPDYPPLSRMAPTTFGSSRFGDLLANLGRTVGGALMAPGQAYQSQTPMTSEQMVKPAADLAMMTTLGSGAVPAEANTLRAGMARYRQALAEGKITPAEYQGFVDALRGQPPGFADKGAARIELNAAQRQVDKYSDLHQARQQAGRTLDAEESRALSDALERKSKAQQYLTSSQPIDLE
jgi:hypothetical protein